MSSRNALEVRIYAHQRSGHHAFIEWVMDHVLGPSVFLNYVVPRKSPFNYGRIAKRPEFRINTNINIKWETSFDEIVSAPKDLLIYNYENNTYSECHTPYTVYSHDKWVGASAKQKDVLFLRDPFNSIASYAKLRNYDLASVDKFRRIYSAMCADITKMSELGDCMVVYYNNWLNSEQYRARLLEKIGLKGLQSRHEPPNKISKWGGGSSFGKGNINEQASDFETRWKSLAGFPKIVAQMLADEEFMHYSRLVCSDLPSIDFERTCIDLMPHSA